MFNLEPDVTLDTYIEKLHPDDRLGVVESIKAAIYEGKPYSIDYRIVPRPGEIHYVHAEGVTTRDNDGRPLIFFGTVLDITERKQAEDALRVSEEMLWHIFDTSPVPMVLYNESKGSYHYNKRFTETFGYTIEDIPSINEWWLLAYPDEKYRELVKKRWYAAVDEAIKKRTSIEPQEVVVTCKGGSKKYILSYFSSIGYMNLSVFYDITERKRAEEERLRLVHDLEERVKELTALYSAARIFQHQRTIQKVLQEIVAILPPAWQYPEITAARIVYDGREYRASGFSVGAWSQSADFVTIDGKRGTIEVFYVEETPPEAEGPFLAEERDLINSLAEMLCIYLDRKQAEEELKSAKAQAELYLDLMGHDINNMHQIALGYLELARDVPACKGQTESLDKSIEVLHRSSRLIQNVKKLQNFRKGLFQTKEVDVCKVLSEIPREFGAVPNKSVSLNLNDCEHCRVVANELLHDVFANLVINAIKHTGACADIFIYLERVEENGQSYCRVSVEDNGPGIPDDNKGTIFNRALMSTSKAKGMGLGLYLVKSLVDGYNGRVWVEDRVQGDYTKGARFVVMLPAA